MTDAAAVYCRISRDPEDLRTGVDRQRADCEEYARRRGWPVAEVYVDNDVSGYRGDPPEWRRMLRDIGEGRRDAVVIYNVDRMTRQPKLFEEFLETCQRAGVRSLGSVGGDIDLGTEDGEFTARVLVAVAKKESDAKSRRIRRAIDDMALRGEARPGGVRPYGYVWDEEAGTLAIKEDEASLLREAAERILSGESRRSITLDWHGRGITTSEGKPWSITRLGQLLAAPRIAGKRVHRGEVVADGNWEAILDEETQERVVKRMRRQAVASRPGRQRHCLTGLAVCGGCGKKLIAKARRGRTGDSFRTYRCSNDSAASCGRTSVVAEPLEQLVLWTAWVEVSPRVEDVFREVIALGETEDPGERVAREALADVTESEKQLAHDHYVEKIVPRDAFLEASANLRGRREDLERELSRRQTETGRARWTLEQMQQVSGPPPTLTDAEPEVVEFWRSVAQTVFERVEVRDRWHGRRFSAERVVLHPRSQFPGAKTPWWGWDLQSMSPEKTKLVAGLEEAK